MPETQKHQVLEKILARAHRKAPFNDGRKIGLVLPGGMMTGVNGAGVMCALQELGLAQSFDVIYTASAGFANASYLLAENTEVGSSIYYEEFSGSQFIHLWKVWEPVSYDRAIEAVRDIKPIDCDKIWSSATDFVLRLSDYSDAGKKRVYIHVKEYPTSDYFNLFRAAISSPIITRCTKIHLRKMCDGQITNKDVISLVQTALDSDCTDLLIVYNQEAQRDIVKLPKAERHFEIVPEPASKIGLFETRAEVLKKAHGAMKMHVLSLFQ